MIKINFALVLVGLLTFTNCTTLSKVYSGTGSQDIKNKFTIGPQTTGKGCAERTLFFVSGDNRKYGFAGLNPFARGTAALARDIAVYDALAKLGTSDLLLSPRISFEDEGNLFTQKTCATVQARGVTLN
jgi:hypothetical protein